MRNAKFDVVSPSITLAQGAFAASALTFSFLTNEPAAVFDYAMVALLINETGAVTLSGWATNKVVTNGTVVANGDSLVLTIPVDADFPLGLLATADSMLTIKGQLVAVGQAEQPGLVIGSITVGGQGITLRWVSEPNQLFHVLGSGNLQNWSDRATVTSTTTEYSWTAPLDSQLEFFKLSRTG